MEPERTLIAVDIGGTKVAAAVLRGRLPGLRMQTPGSPGSPAVKAVGGAGAPTVVARSTVPTDGSSPQACFDGVVSCLADLAQCAGPLDGIGVGVASMVEFAAGRVVASVNLPLNDLPLRDLLQQRFGVPVVIDNDATAAAIGEHVYGAGRGTSDMIMLTLGTGVGGGIIAGGRPYRGFSGAAAELGHLMIDIDGPDCPAACPNHGCLEAYVSGTALGAAALAEARARPHTALGRALSDGRPIDSRLLTALAQRGDRDAAAVLERAGAVLGAGITTLVNVFNPELVVVGGGAAAAGDLLLEPARREVAARALRPARDEVRIVPATLGPDAGLIGAGALALTELFPEGSSESGACPPSSS